MAKRDVQLVIRARSEADRAIDSISAALRTLAGVQDQVSGSGERTSNTLERLAGAFSSIDAAFAKIDQSVTASQQSLTAQQASLAANEARYNALSREIRAAEQAIVSTSVAIRSASGRDLSQLQTQLIGAQQAYRQLTGESTRLEGTITAQRADVIAAGSAYEGLQNAATAAQMALGTMGDAGEREALRVAVSAREAQQALLDQAAAARQEVAARNAQSAINQQLGVRDIQPGSASASAAVFEEDARAKEQAAQATRDLDVAAERLKNRLNPMRAEQARINAEMQEARTLYNAGKISIRDLTGEMQRLEGQMKRVQAAQNNLNRNGSKEFKGVLGLRPFELQNLSYQINDVVTGLASGQPVGQVFAQQGGQIIQLFPKLLTGALKYARGLTLVGLALAPVVIGMGRLGDLAALQRDFDASLRLSADGANYNTQALIANVDALDEFGASFEDATAAVKTFLHEGIDPAMFDAMGESAQNLADITGKDLTDAAKDVAEAFSGGYKEIAKFDDDLNFLTLSEREQIRAMFDSGDASDARTLAFQRFFDKAQEGARETSTAWDRMVRAMGGVWQSFKEWISDTSFLKGLRQDLYNATVGATYLLNRMRGLKHEKAALDALGVSSPSKGAPKTDPLDATGNRYLKEESDRKYEEAKKKKNKGGKSTAEYQADYNRELELANRNREIQAEHLNKTNVLIGESLILEQRRFAISEAIRQAEEKTTKNSKHKLTLSQKQRDEIARTTALEFDAKNAKAVAQAQREEHERKINDLMARRTELVKSLDYQTPGSAAYQQTEQAIEGLDGKIKAATAAAIAFWQEVAGDPTKAALLGVTAEQIASITAGLQNSVSKLNQDGITRARQQAEAGLDDLRQMQDLLQKQIEFAQLNGEAGRAGQLQEQLAQVNVKLVEGADRAIAFWQAIAGDPEKLAALGYTVEQVNNIILGLENSKAAAEELHTQFLKTGQALNQDLAQGGTNALDQFAQSIVNGENVLRSFADAFLQFAADFLLQIARMIAQQALFNALSGGQPGGGGGAGGFISGLIGGLFHGGGVVGSSGRSRALATSIFANATRYHTGGIAGLRPDEVPAILRRGEEVLTAQDARHRRNGGGAGKGLSQVLAIGEEAIAKAIAGSAGREVILTHIRQDRATIRQELGIS